MTCVLWFATLTQKEDKSPGTADDIISQEYPLQHPTRTSSPDTMATTVEALAMALVVSVASVMAMVPTTLLEAMVVVAVATSIPLSIEDTGPLDFTENMIHLH